MSYFYKNANGAWVIGNSPKSRISKSDFRLTPNEDGTFSLNDMNNNWPIINRLKSTEIMKNDAGQFYADDAAFLIAADDFFLKASAGGGSTDALTLQSHPASYFQTALGFTPEQAGVAEGLITTLKGSVATEGDTLKKLYDLIVSQYTEVTVATIAARDTYNVPKLPISVFVTDDGDGKWALYKALTTGVGATYIKISDPDLLNAVMTATQIAAAYEGIADVNRFTNDLKQSVIDSAAWIASHTVAILAHLIDNVSHITGTERTTWNAKLTASKAEIEGLLTGVISTHSHNVTKADVGLPLADNTSDANKPVSTAQAAANTVILNAAATDATTKAGNAQTAAIATAAADATTKDNAVLTAANKQSIINALIF